MNNLFSKSWLSETEMTRTSSISDGANLNAFFSEIESIKLDLDKIDDLNKLLFESNSNLKTMHNAKEVKVLRTKMDADVADALKKAKAIKLRLESLDRSVGDDRTAEDRMRSSVVGGLRKKLKDQIERFQKLKGEIANDYKETIQRRYHTVTGEKPNEETVETLIRTGEGETFMQRAIQEQGRGRVIDVIAEINERHGATMDLEKGLLELQQVFMDMSVLVTAQGEQLDDIENQVGKARSFVQRGTAQLVVAKKHQKNTRKWTFFAIILLLIIILVIVLPIVLNNSK